MQYYGQSSTMKTQKRLTDCEKGVLIALRNEGAGKIREIYRAVNRSPKTVRKFLLYGEALDNHKNE